MPFTNIKKFIITSLTLLSLSCTTYTGVTGEHSVTSTSSASRSMSKAQHDIVMGALQATSMGYNSTLTFGGKKFNNDCSGLIYGIYWNAGIDIPSAIANESGNGVKRIHSVLTKKGLIHYNKLPNPGDLIFWDNTYGEWGSKPLSHIGIVVSVDGKGNIEYVHNNTYLGEIRKERMNLFTPHETRPVNNYMRYDSKYKKTAGELFSSFGMAWKL